jgi:hypothetical protein
MHGHDELRLVEQAEADLEQEFPQVPPEHVRKIVSRLWGDLTAAKVRDSAARPVTNCSG